MKQQLFRQGDVALIKVEKASGKKAKSTIVARGEHSNHSHIITGDAEVMEENGTLYVLVGDDGASIEHLLETSWLAGKKEWTGEHHPIVLEKGFYEVRIQQQYDPYKKAVEAVLD